MNLSEIKSQIYAISDYKPGNPNYEREIEDLINSNYMAIWNARPWTFANKQVYMDVYSDITPARAADENGSTSLPLLVPVKVTAQSPVTMAPTSGSIAAVFTQPVNRLTNHGSLYIGNPIEVLGVEYTIIHIEWWSGSITLDGTSTPIYARIFVDKPFQFTATSTSDWKIKQRYLFMPDDLSETVAVSYRPWPFVGASAAWQSLRPIDLFRDVRTNVNVLGQQETSGDAYAYVRETDQTIPSGGKISYTTTVAVGDVTGDFSAGDTFEVAWAYVGSSGAIGPIGEVKTISIPSSTATTTCHFSLTLLHTDGSTASSKAYANPESYQFPDDNLKYGKQVFYNANWDWTAKKRLGPPKWIPISYAATATSGTYGPAASPTVYQRWLGSSNFVDWQLVSTIKSSSTLPIRLKSQLRQATSVSQDYRFGPKYERIRLFPRPDSYDKALEKIGTPQNPGDTTGTISLPLDYVQRLTLTYRYVPAALGFQSDAPELPQEFHSLVVWATLRDVYTKNSNVALSQLYDGKYTRGLKDLAKRHVTYTDAITTKGGQNNFPKYPSYRVTYNPK